MAQQPDIYLSDYFPPDVIASHENHVADLYAIAAASSETMMKKYLAALTKFWYPDVAPDMFHIGPASSYTAQFNYPGLIRLKKVELFAPGGTYPSQLDVTIDKISHIPFTLTEKNAAIGPFGFQLVGGSFVTFNNPDVTNAANVYIEWEMVNYG
jgi:hypothetical protein